MTACLANCPDCEVDYNVTTPQRCICGGSVSNCNALRENRHSSISSGSFTRMAMDAKRLENRIKIFINTTYTTPHTTVTDDIQSWNNCMEIIDIRRHARGPGLTREKESENLEMDFQSLQTVVAMLSLMKEETPDNNDFNRNVSRIQSKVTSLMCKQLRGINILGIKHLNRRITPTVRRWCQIQNTMLGDIRNRLLLGMMADLSCTLYGKYNVLAGNC